MQLELQRQVELRLELLKSATLLQGAKLIADLATNTLMVLCGILAFLFATITLGFLLVSLMGSAWKGFGTLALIMTLFAFSMLGFGGKLMEKAIGGFSVRRLLKKYGGTDE
ncbi:MAG: hypothetical protein EOP49_32355 [Sphingobacteriales bacterium]|nr:MAG: hypothetical protein EOP49_32355 [Sphingobacteriales bacterium]